MKRVIAFLGPPAIGKDTQIGELDREKFQVLPMGQRLCERFAAGDWSCSAVKEGGIVPTDVALPIVAAGIDSWLHTGARTDMVLNGFPRTADAADGLDALIEAKDLSLTVIWLTATNDSTIDARRKNRIAAAVAAGKDMHIGDQDGTVFERRLRDYKELTLPLMDRYKARGQLFEISGEQSIESVRDAVCVVVECPGLFQKPAPRPAV